MRSSLYGRPARPSSTAVSANAVEMEEQLHRENEAILSALGSHVGSMKAMASRLHGEAQEQNGLLRDLQQTFTGARSGVARSISGVRGIMDSYGGRQTWTIALALSLLLMVLYCCLLR